MLLVLVSVALCFIVQPVCHAFGVPVRALFWVLALVPSWKLVGDDSWLLHVARRFPVFPGLAPYAALFSVTVASYVFPPIHTLLPLGVLAGCMLVGLGSQRTIPTAPFASSLFTSYVGTVVLAGCTLLGKPLTVMLVAAPGGVAPMDCSSHLRTRLAPAFTSYTVAMLLPKVQLTGGPLPGLLSALGSTVQAR